MGPRGKRRAYLLSVVAVCPGYATIGYPARDQATEHASNIFRPVSLNTDATVGGGIASPGHAHTTHATGFATPCGVNYSRCHNTIATGIATTERGTTISNFAANSYACAYGHRSQRTCYLYHPGCPTYVILLPFMRFKSHMFILF
jgi:hypothetical protein